MKKQKIAYVFLAIASMVLFGSCSEQLNGMGLQKEKQKKLAASKAQPTLNPANPIAPSTPNPANPTAPATLNPANPTAPVTPNPTNPTTPSTPNPANPTAPATLNPANPTAPVTPNPTNPTTPSTPNPANPTAPATPNPTNPSTPLSDEQRKEILFRRLLNACLRYEETVDVSDLHISCSKANEEHKRLYYEFLQRYLFVFHLIEDGGITINYQPENENMLAKYRFDYKMKNHAFDTDFQRFEQALEAFYDTMQEGMSEAELSFVLYRALLKKTSYTTNNIHSFDALGAIMEGQAVCQGYGLGYQRLMNGIGIETVAVAGPIPNAIEGHMWNRIKLDGYWYNAEPTWDDHPKPNKYRQNDCTGRYFLTSDDVFHGILGHPRPFSEEYVDLPPANNDKYDSSACVFRNSDKKSLITYHNGWWYYILDSERSIYRSRFDGSEVEMLHQKDDEFPLYSNLNVLAFGKDKLYFIDYVKNNNKTAHNKEYAVYSLAYDSKTAQYEKPFPGSMTLLKEEYDQPVHIKGINALRGEIALARIRDAYFHGTEDYFIPQDERRKIFIAAIQEAEALVKSGTTDMARAAVLYEKLYNLRKTYTMPRTASK